MRPAATSSERLCRLRAPGEDHGIPRGAVRNSAVRAISHVARVRHRAMHEAHARVLWLTRVPGTASTTTGSTRPSPASSTRWQVAASAACLCLCICSSRRRAGARGSLIWARVAPRLLLLLATESCGRHLQHYSVGISFEKTFDTHSGAASPLPVTHHLHPQVQHEQ